jgi:hypothetical protein
LCCWFIICFASSFGWQQWRSARNDFNGEVVSWFLSPFFLLLCKFVLFLLIMEANYRYWLIATSPLFFWYSVTFLLPEFLFTMRMTPCK